jgi:hypothetical protein
MKCSSSMSSSMSSMKGMGSPAPTATK